MKILTKAIPIILAVTGIVYFVYVNGLIKTIDEQIALKEAEVNTLSEKVMSLDTKKDNIEKKDFTKKDLTFITEFGDKLAKMQNDMVNSLVDIETEKQYKKDILSYFEDGTPEKAGMDWFNAVPDKLNWQFKTTYGFTDNYVDAVWELTTVDKTENFPVAYAVAKYDSSTKKFRDFARYSTVIGNTLIKPEEAYENEYNADTSIKKSTDDLIKDMENKVDDGSISEVSPTEDKWDNSDDTIEDKWINPDDNNTQADSDGVAGLDSDEKYELERGDNHE